MLHVYGKPGCSKCEILKQQLNAKGITYQYYTHGQDWTTEWIQTLIPKNVRMLPIVLKDNDKGEKEYMTDAQVNEILTNG